VIAELLPAGVASAEAFDDAEPCVLFAAEEAAIGRAVDKRRREFTTARRCARRALADLGYPPVPLVPGRGGAPGWPTGAVGSMTHCTGYRAAAVAPVAVAAAVGIDAEPHLPLPTGLWGTVARHDERRRLAELADRHRGVCWDRLLFSAKEAVYKAWFPLARRWLDFHDVEVTVHPATGTFDAALLVDGPDLDGGRLTAVRGRWLVNRGLVIAAVTVPGPAGAA
jgi:4'-phosphopantetheinyl transferase EntD